MRMLPSSSLTVPDVQVSRFGQESLEGGSAESNRSILRCRYLAPNAVFGSCRQYAKSAMPDVSIDQAGIRMSREGSPALTPPLDWDTLKSSYPMRPLTGDLKEFMRVTRSRRTTS